ncbi:conserved hypothetical protein [Tenacibaculum maritimum]|nr:conserved hypothetical protein [Tenacibaculum maritimum]
MVTMKKNIDFKIIISVITFLFLKSIVYAQLDYSKFEGIKSKITIVKEFSFVNVYDYNFNSSGKDSLLVQTLNDNSLEAAISKEYAPKFINNTKDSISFSVKLLSRLIIDVDNKRHYFVSYKTSDNNVKMISIFLNNGNHFIESTSSNSEIELLKSILMNSNAYLLFQLYNERNNPNYPEINKLKPFVKDPKGNLNIKKLAKVLEENKTLLAKYLDD